MSLTRTPALLVLASLALAWGCKGDPEETGDPCPEGDNCIDDCDPDPCMNDGVCTDVGEGFECECTEDWDGDTCEDFVGPTFFGTVSYDTMNDDAVACDAVIDLVGWDYTGDCSGCDFAFEIESTVTEDNGTADCYLFWGLTFQEGGGRIPMFLAKWDTYTGYYGDTYDNALMTGFAVDYTAYGGGYYPGPYWWFISYDGHPYGTATIGADSMSWAWDYSAEQFGDPEYYYYSMDPSCPEPARSEVTSAYPGSWEQVHTLGCLDPTDPSDVSLTDVYTVDLEAGDDLAFTVDTVSSDSKFLPYIWVNGLDECVAITAVDNYACTFELDYGCPTLEYTAPAAGTYELVVYAHPQVPCTGDMGEYNLVLGLPEGVEPAVLADEKPISHAEVESIFYLESEASATF